MLLLACENSIDTGVISSLKIVLTSMLLACENSIAASITSLLK